MNNITRDDMVLKAQKWVNSTYSSKPGFQKAPENGNTGWPTMFALTMGLQIELGISDLSPNFGPTTLNLLTQKFPNIGKGFKGPKNITKLIQSAMYCKGYDGSNISGDFDSRTEAGISSLINDMTGTSKSGNVTPKVFKALLTMDAYIRVNEGSEKIRGIQQWLNNKYINRRNFFYMPCDGHFYRDVQKYLMFAIQYEIGMDDDTANGVFGPGTKEGLKQHQLSLGSNNIFVNLFKAAHIFNSYISDVSFNSNFDSTLEKEVRDFQSFAAISVNGQGNYETWCEYLVSTGDPDRATTAIDCSANKITAERAKYFKSKGIQSIGRYLKNVDGSSFDKELEIEEMNIMQAYGITMFPIMQLDGGNYEYFTYEQGVRNAQIAQDRADNFYKFPKNSVIYFAVDYDAVEEEIKAGVTEFFKGINNTLKNYTVGIYGSRNVCSIISNQGLAVHSFVSGMSTGFSGNLGFPLPKNWSFNQIKEDFNLEVDYVVKRGTDNGIKNLNNPTPSNPKNTWNLTRMIITSIDLKNKLGFDCPNGTRNIQLEQNKSSYIGLGVMVNKKNITNDDILNTDWFLMIDDKYNMAFFKRDDLFNAQILDPNVDYTDFKNTTGYEKISPNKVLVNIKDFIDIDKNPVSVMSYNAPYSNDGKGKKMYQTFEGGQYWAYRAFPNRLGREVYLIADDKSNMGFLTKK